MAFTGIITKAAAAVSLSIAGLSGVDAVVKFTAPPIIEGVGFYGALVSVGEVVPIEWTITKRTDCEGALGRVWIGEGGFYLVESLRPSGLPSTSGPVEYLVQTQIPILAPPGELVLSIKGEYDCPNGAVKFTLGPVILEVIE